jgi:hypothetical protein
MKKAALPVALLLACVGLSGCPVYEDDDLACFDDYDCPNGHFCDYPSGACIRDTTGATATCDAPSDCAANETCSKNAICAAGDCSFATVGCVRGFECSSESGRWKCVPEGSNGNGGGGGDGGAPMTNNGGAPSMSNGGVPGMSNGGAPSMSGGGMPEANGGVGG